MELTLWVYHLPTPVETPDSTRWKVAWAARLLRSGTLPGAFRAVTNTTLSVVVPWAEPSTVPFLSHGLDRTVTRRGAADKAFWTPMT